MKKIFITGGTGFIGKAIVANLANMNYEIFVLSRRAKADCGNTHFLQGNIADPVFLQTVMQNIQPHILLHLAWNVKTADYTKQAENNEWVQWSCQLATAFLAAGGKTVIAAGTCFEYDLTLNKSLSETSLCRPATIYGKCKLETYRLLKEKCAEYKARFVWGRIFYPYGSGEEQRKIFSSVIFALRQQQKFSCSSPENIVDYIHVCDVAGIFVKFIECENIADVVNIASGYGYKVKELLIFIAQKLNSENLLEFIEQSKWMVVVSNSTKLVELNYKFSYDLDKGITEMINDNQSL